MASFDLSPGAVAASRARAAARSTTDEVLDLAAAARAGEALDDEALAALFLSPSIYTDDLLELACDLRSPGPPHIETFSPLYLTNECDAECRMCGMRSANGRLLRETADEATVEAQLDLLYGRGLRGVALLTGEYHRGARRRVMIARSANALRAALKRGFAHVLINIGSLDEEEYDVLLAGVPRDGWGRVVPRVTVCTFQETYDSRVYASFMGTSAENPRSDFGRRLRNLDRASDAGIRLANPGVLLGLNRDIAYELLALLAHIRHLMGRGMTVYVSLPRLRKASGATYHAGVSDDALVRLVAVLSFGMPQAKLVISTREPPPIQRRLLPAIRVLTPGSPGVAPYTEAGARFEMKASQFEVLDHRSIEAILGEFLEAGTTIDCYEPPTHD